MGAGRLPTTPVRLYREVSLGGCFTNPVTLLVHMLHPGSVIGLDLYHITPSTTQKETEGAIKPKVGALTRGGGCMLEDKGHMSLQNTCLKTKEENPMTFPTSLRALG